MHCQRRQLLQWALRTPVVLAASCAAGSLAWGQTRATTPVPSAAAGADAAGQAAQTLIAAARSRVGTGEVYDPAYRSMAYPGGDVPQGTGVCTDVVIRAYRTLGLDLQVLVHEDMKAHFSAYPKIWGLRSTDRNIDHRRVPNLQTYFKRQGAALPVSQNSADYAAGDLVTWMLPGNLPHIGIVSDRKNPRNQQPLILHNIGAGSVENDILLAYPITGHYRFFP